MPIASSELCWSNPVEVVVDVTTMVVADPPHVIREIIMMSQLACRSLHVPPVPLPTVRECQSNRNDCRRVSCHFVASLFLDDHTCVFNLPVHVRSPR